MLVRHTNYKKRPAFLAERRNQYSESWKQAPRPHFPYFWNSQSLLSSGHTCLVFNQRDMQWKWKACYSPVSFRRVEKARRQRCLHCRFPRRPCTPHSSMMLDSLDTRCLRSRRRLAQIRSVTTTAPDGQCNSQRSMMWFLQMAQLSTTISHAHKATAFHYEQFVSSCS